MADSRTVAEYGICSGDTIELSLRLRGGMDDYSDSESSVGDLEKWTDYLEYGDPDDPWEDERDARIMYRLQAGLPI